MRRPALPPRPENSLKFSPADVFVPNDGDRQSLATLLVGTAAEYNLPQRSIRATARGFWITSELADIIYDETVPEPEPEKTSGDLPEKNKNKRGNKP
jgi:hypothetical protein